MCSAGSNILSKFLLLAGFVYVTFIHLCVFAGSNILSKLSLDDRFCIWHLYTCVCIVGFNILSMLSLDDRFYIWHFYTCMCIVGLFYNGTNGNLTCFDIDTEFIECADATGCGTGPAAISWDYQVIYSLLYIGYFVPTSIWVV